MSLALQVMHITAQGPVSEMTYTVSSGTLNSTITYHTIYQSVERSNCSQIFIEHLRWMINYCMCR